MSTHSENYNPLIENVIEITKLWVYYRYGLPDVYYKEHYEKKEETFDLPYTEINRYILDWAEEFEARIGDAYDWESSEWDYLLLIDDFATKKIMELLDVPKYKWPKQNTDIDFDKPGRWL